ncbi:LacI family DNA-binding transcriptional regulator [Taklimakanibacter lacteus]|uniref:LacI family DNA-binding transcriptional regulator n=1 Tax=Taklimakanibacter lacteus TaxID=2268456 RepID=UPI0034D6D72A
MSDRGKKGRSGKRRGFVSALQVARKAGVSRSAVSRSFTPGASVAEDTREKVIRAAAELGYHVNDLARGLLARQSRLVGLIATRPEIGFRAQLTAELSKALIRRGNVPVLINVGESAAELAAAQQTLLGYRAEASVILTGSPSSEFVDLARRNGQPVIVLGRSEPGADQIRSDGTRAARQAARLFVESGLTRLGLAGSRSGTPAIVEREQAFRAEALKLGAEVRTAQGADSDYEGGLAAARALIGGGRAPEGIFCVNDPIAFGVMDHARLVAGLTVPRDLKVIGFDDVPEAQWLNYRLTTFRQDPAAIARKVVALLDQRQAEPERAPFAVKLTAPLILRDSFTIAQTKDP